MLSAFGLTFLLIVSCNIFVFVVCTNLKASNRCTYLFLMEKLAFGPGLIASTAGRVYFCRKDIDQLDSQN